MYDQSFTKKTLKAEIKNSDYYRIPDLDDEKDIVADEAYNKSQSIVSGANFTLDLSFTNTNSKNKVIYNVKNFSDKILLRKIARNIKVITRTKQADRNSVIKNLISLLREGVGYRVYRKDIKNFYGSINTSELICSLEKNWNISKSTNTLIKKLFIFTNQKEAGLPRGLQTSVILAEYVMKDFDDKIKNHPDVFFYARYVDDILIITRGNEDSETFQNYLDNQLFNGLVFNRSKDKEQTVKIDKLKKETEHEVSSAQPKSLSISFLGYSMSIHKTAFNAKETKKARRVDVDLSPNKVKKFKTKIIKSFLAFLVDGDFDLLHDRIKLMTGNFYIFDRDKNTRQMAGIYFSYKYITVSPSDMNSNIKSLDTFLLNVVLSGKGRISSKLTLTPDMRRKILEQTFSNGFNNRVIHHYNIRRISEITRCWQHD